jgi:hypothetical protein
MDNREIRSILWDYLYQGLWAASHNPNLMYVSIGAAARSKQGALYRSRDLFRTFEAVG